MADPVTVSAFMASWFTPSSLFLFLNLVIGTIVLSSRFNTPRKPYDHHDGHPHLVRSSSLLERLKSLHFYKHDTAFPETEYLQPPHDSLQLVRTPSPIERVRSFDFRFNNSCEPPVQKQPSIFSPLTTLRSSFEHFPFNNNCEPTGAETVSAPPDDPTEDEHPTEPQLARTPSLLERLKSINFSSLYRSDSIEAAGEAVEGEGDVRESREDHGSSNLARRSKSETSKRTPVKLPEKMKKSASEKSASRKREEEEEEEEETAARHVEGNEAASCLEDEMVDAKADDFINKFKQQLKLQRLNSFLRYNASVRGVPP
ncbi:pathogen-associated molecular patterns-induced protein A70-like [Prosopis cineraria]|uniref:pathogen-associated molecular patterns-induced protein A70-like n=1 Tax=Prosopis cineraria TaxID=364024 RepID=UPI00241045F2|nr:pathogen-associated molecular patterns-induced protein A70-like [Prosopis cineraria]